jgi:predicted Zn-dependent peptidase
VTRSPRPRRAARRAAARAVATLAVATLAAASLAAAAATRPARAQLPAPPPGLPAPAAIRVERYQLTNGFTVILAPERSGGVVAVDLWYDVGSRDEQPGRTGFAHLFEHLMFQGSDHVGRGEHVQLVARAGGQAAGAARADVTQYAQVLPSDRLALGLWLEADRMRSLAMTSATLENQKAAVREERRVRFDAQPYAGTLLEALAGAYDPRTCFAYGHLLIGSPGDLDAAGVDDVRAFFRTYYAPNNATLVVAGDFDAPAARGLVARYFADIPRAAPPPPVRCEQPFHPGAQRRTATDARAARGAVLAAYRIPEYRSPDLPALTLLGIVLGQGEGARLHRAAVRDARAAATAQVLLNPLGPTRGPGLFGVFAVAGPGVRPDSLEGLIAAEVARLVRDGVTDAELARARTAYVAGVVDGLQRSLGRAEAIHTANTFLGDPNAVHADLARFAGVTAADVRRVARQYLVPANGVAVRIAAAEAPGP